MKLVLRHRECDTDKLASLLLNAGYRLRSDDVTLPSLVPSPSRIIRGLSSDSEAFPVSSVFGKHRETVATLTHLCRLCVRHSVATSCRGRHFADSLRKLPLPTVLRDFVAFSGEFTLDLC